MSLLLSLSRLIIFLVVLAAYGIWRPRYWYYAVPPAYLIFLLWFQPADRPVMIASSTPPPDYPLKKSATRLVTDDCDTLAYVLRAENAARGRKAGVTGEKWFHKGTGLRGYDPKHPDDYELRKNTPYEPWAADDQKEFDELLKQPRADDYPLGLEAVCGSFVPDPRFKLLDRYFLEYPPLALYLFRLGLIGAPGEGADVHPALFDTHQFQVGAHAPATPDEVALYARFRHALQVYAVLMIAAQLGLMLLLDFGFPRGPYPIPTWLLILPGFLYFTPCRFDILPAFLVVASVVAANRRTLGMVALSGLLLGLAVGLKMYPLVLAPILLRFAARSWWGALVWCACAAIPVVGSYGLMYMTDGIEGATVPLKFQLAREPEPDWCFYQGKIPEPPDTPGGEPPVTPDGEPVMRRTNRFLPWELSLLTPAASAFRALPVLLISLLMSIRRPPDVFSLLRRSTVAVIAFLTLSVFFSPQWWQWLAVMLVPLCARHRWLIGFVVALDLWTYLHFPLMFDGVMYGGLGDSAEWVRDVHVLVRAQLWFAVAAAFAWIEVRSTGTGNGVTG